MRKTVALGVSILLTLAVFLMSLQTGPQSSALSSPLARFVGSVLEALFPRLSVDPDTLHLIVRKGAHMTEYAALGVSYMITARTWRVRVWPVYPAGALVALLDEGLQTFAAQRFPALLDALLFDLPGFVIGASAVVVVTRLLAVRRNRQKNNVS